jgi:hypothetical protein
MKVPLVKLHNNGNKKNFLIICFFYVPLLFCSCGGGSVTTLPEAPPPYPNFPVPYEPSDQSAPSSGSYDNQQSRYQPNSYDPNQYRSPTVKSNSSWDSSPNALTPSPNYSRFTVHAKANLWLLIQDANGNELDWLKLQEGEKVPISHIGALTITCSSGQDVEIFNKEGRKIDSPGSNKPGISIIRLN